MVNGFFFFQLDDFQILDFAAVDGEPYEGTYLVKTVYAGCSGIDVQHVEGLVVHHFQNVTVTGYEEFWRTGKEAAAYGGVVVAWIASYMLDQHFHVLTPEAVSFAEHDAEVAPVDVAEYGTQHLMILPAWT